MSDNKNNINIMGKEGRGELKSGRQWERYIIYTYTYIYKYTCIYIYTYIYIFVESERVITGLIFIK